MQINGKNKLINWKNVFIITLLQTLADACNLNF